MRQMLALMVILAGARTLAGPLEDSGVSGGLAVVIGGDDTKLINDLGRNEKFLVQVLDTDASKIRIARDAIHKAGNYGRVSAVVFDGKALPYADNLVDLIPPLHSSGARRVHRSWCAPWHWPEATCSSPAPPRCSGRGNRE